MAAVNANERPPIGLTADRMTRFKPAKIFKQAVEPVPPSTLNTRTPPPRHITSIAFDDRGEYLVTAAEDETFRVYNAKAGKFKSTLNSKKYGVDLIRFTHKATNLIHSSTKEDDALRYHSWHDNKYITYFKGHTKRVISLDMCPIDDSFVSGSLDHTVRIWDLRTPSARGLLHVPGDPIVAHDNLGVVLAVGVPQYSRILLYDKATFDKEPFLTITLHDPTLERISFPPRIPVMTSLNFSTDGKWLLVGTSSDVHYLMDAFDGKLVARLEGHTGLERGKGSAPGVVPVRGISGEELSWSPDSHFIISGSHDGRIVVWDIGAWCPQLVERCKEINLENVPPIIPPPLVIKPHTALAGHPGPSRCVKFNPRFAMMAAGGTDLSMWLPDLANEPDKDGDVRMKGQ